MLANRDNRNVMATIIVSSYNNFPQFDAYQQKNLLQIVALQ